MQSSRFRHLITLFAVVGLTVALSACGSSGSSKASEDTTATTSAPASGGGGAGITIKDFTFTAGSVAAGSTVTVTNNDSATHTVTSDDGTSFNVTVDAGKTATFTAPAAGTYKFHCNIHSQMHGSLTVT